MPPPPASCCPSLSAPRVARHCVAPPPTPFAADGSSCSAGAETLGPTFVKFGQALANRPDLVGLTLATRCASSKTPCLHSTTPTPAASSPTSSRRAGCEIARRVATSADRRRVNLPSLPRRARRAAARRGRGQGAAARRARDRRRRRGARACGGELLEGCAAGRRAAAAAGARALGRRILLASLRGVRLRQREGQPRRLRGNIRPVVSRGKRLGGRVLLPRPLPKYCGGACCDELGRRRAADMPGTAALPASELLSSASAFGAR